MPRPVAFRQPVHVAASAASAQNATPHNLILFVPDGLRAFKVTPETAPAMAEVRDKGVSFKNSHSLFPTFTMANASALSSGHYLGDTGTFSNTIYTRLQLGAGRRYGGALHRERRRARRRRRAFQGRLPRRGYRVEARAREKGFSTAAIGKVGPTLIFDHTDPRQDPYGHHRRFHWRQDRCSALRRDEGRPDQGEPAAGPRPAAATTARLVTPRRRGQPPPTSPSRPISPMSPPRSCCRCSSGAQQALRAGFLVARSRRQPAQSG